eukprot:3967554-Amphidinium_carterae.2
MLWDSNHQYMQDTCAGGFRTRNLLTGTRKSKDLLVSMTKEYYNTLLQLYNIQQTSKSLSTNGKRRNAIG